MKIKAVIEINHIEVDDPKKLSVFTGIYHAITAKILVEDIEEVGIKFTGDPVGDVMISSGVVDKQKNEPIRAERAKCVECGTTLTHPMCGACWIK